MRDLLLRAYVSRYTHRLVPAALALPILATLEPAIAGAEIRPRASRPSGS